MSGKRSRRKKILVVVLAIVLGGAALRFGSDAWGRLHNAATTATAKKEIAEERARLEKVRFPPAEAGSSRAAVCDLHGIELGYLGSTDWMDVRVAAAKPQGEVSGSVESTIRKVRPELAKLSEALRCDRLDPAPILAMAADDGSTMSAGLIVDAHLKIREGEIDAGVTRYLEGARLAAQSGASHAWSGWLACKHAFLALARLMASRDDAPYDRIAMFLAALEPVLPSNRIFARHYRLALGDAAELAHRERAVPISAPKYWGVQGWRRLRMQAYVFFVPQSVRYAQAMTELDALLRRAEALSQGGSSPARRALENDVFAIVETTTNPYVHDLATAGYNLEEVAGGAAFAMVQAVARLESIRRATGRVPSSLPAEPWAQDPAADAAAFRYELTSNGAGYRLWSVGKDGKDDGGAGDDVLVSHQAR